VPRFLSPEWAAAVTAVLSELPPTDASSPGPGAHRTSFSVAQLIHDVPGDLGADGGLLATVLEVSDGRATLSVRMPGGDGGLTDGADVVLSVAYEDAAALSRGDLHPASALASGKVRVRGDLSLLVAGQEILAVAGAQLEEIRSITTY